jgi:hypothetical protein
MQINFVFNITSYLLNFLTSRDKNVKQYKKIGER